MKKIARNVGLLGEKSETRLMAYPLGRQPMVASAVINEISSRMSEEESKKISKRS
jgi:hypothetical protein